MEAGSAGLALAVVLAVAAPFVLAVATSFAKLAVVAGLLRVGLGAPGVPPMSVIVGLSALLSVSAMWPVGEACLAAYEAQAAAEASGGAPGEAPATGSEVERWWRAALGPVSGFWRAHAEAEDVALFEGLAARSSSGDWGEGGAVAMTADAYAWRVLAPAFLLTELTEAFQVGVLVLLPFLVIDLAVSTVLSSVGMPMLSPT
ncbi:MAG: flagellar type III secretion system pore protein FliP, partial [Planctomycetota bacterium]